MKLHSWRKLYAVADCASWSTKQPMDAWRKTSESLNARQRKHHTCEGKLGKNAGCVSTASVYWASVQTGIRHT